MFDGLFYLFTRIIEALADFFRRNRAYQILFSVLSLAGLGILIQIYILLSAQPLRLGEMEAPVTTSSLLPVFILVGLFLISILSAVALSLAPPTANISGLPTSLESLLESGVDALRTKRVQNGADAGNVPPEDIIDAIKLNLGQLIEYYVINKGQAKSSFRMSVIAIVVGFFTLISGVWLSYTGDMDNKTSVYISVIAGTILQFIGGA